MVNGITRNDPETPEPDVSFRGSVQLCAILCRGPLDAALQPPDFRGQLTVRRGAQVRVDAAFVLDRADRCRGHPQPDRAEHIGKNRSVLQVGQKATLGLDVGMADIVADLDAFAGDNTFRAPCGTSPKHTS